MVELLEQGDDGHPAAPEDHRDGAGRSLPRWLARAAGAAVLAGLVVAGAGPLLRDTSLPVPGLAAGTTAPGTRQPSGTADGPGDADPDGVPSGPAAAPAGRAGAPLQAAPTGLFTAGEHVLLGTADGVVRVDLGTGDLRRLGLPLGRYVAVPGGVVAGPGGDVVVAAFPAGESTGFSATAYAVGAAGERPRHLGWGSRVVPDTEPGAVWLERTVEGLERNLQRVGLDGGRRGASVRLPVTQGLAAATRAGLVVGPRPDYGVGGPVEVLDPATGAVRHRISPQGRVLDVAADRVLWVTTPCQPCLPLVSRLGTDVAAPALLDLDDRLPVTARLSPDGRHAAAVVGGEQRGTWDVVVAHVPGDRRAGLTTVAISGLTPAGGADNPDLPRLSWTRSGWLVVSDSRRLYVVGPGPHPALVVDADVPAHVQLSAG